MRSRSSLLTLLACTALAAPSRAHELWLSPSDYVAARGSASEVGCLVGAGFRGEPRPYPGPRALKWRVRSSRETDLRPLAAGGELLWARVVAPDDGGALFAYESSFLPIELPAVEFDAYLALEGLDGPLAARKKQGAAAGPGRERYARCAKLWVAGRDAARALKPVGLTLELVPLDSPGASNRLRARLLYKGRPLAGAMVKAFRQPLASRSTPRDAAARDSVGATFTARTGADGTVNVPIDAPGEWLVSAVHMVPSEDRSEADWQSMWASLSFARIEPRGRAETADGPK